MTETNLSPTRPAGEPTARSDIPFRPTDLLMHLIVAFLAPMFLCVSAGDSRIARLAATETINAYRAHSHADLLAIAQIIGFGLAALGSLSLSMADDLSLAMTLRLRANANACHRAAEQNRRALNQAGPATAIAANSDDAPAFDTDDAIFEASVVAGVAAMGERTAAAEARMNAAQASDATQTFDEAPIATPVTAATPKASAAPMAATTRIAQPRVAAPAAIVRTPIAAAAPATPPTAEQQRMTMWAAGAARIAAEFTADLPNLPPQERRAATLRAAALTSSANDLLSGNTEPRLQPGALAAMMRSNTL